MWAIFDYSLNSLNKIQRSADIPGEFVDLCDEIILDDVERVLCGQELVVLRDEVLNLFPHP